MLTKKQIKEIKEHLERAQNPIFFFDNDVDGLCSFLLLRKYGGKGKGVCVKSYPEMTKDYFRKVNELKADYIFILDKPVVSEEFWQEVDKVNIPCVWVDHHRLDKQEVPEFVYYYNPLFNKKKGSEPTTYLCYQVSQRKEDLWLAVLGCIADKFMPDFYSEFEEEYPELSIKIKSKKSGLSEEAFDVYYKSQIGKVAHIFGFALLDRTTNVINMLKFLIKAKNPHEVLEENQRNYSMHKRFKQIDAKYQKLLEKAMAIGRKSDKILFFKFSGDLSISGCIANELSYRFPDKIIIVAYVTEIKASIGMRGKNVRDLLLKAIKDIKDATGGGHPNAVGAKVMIKDLEKFRENLEKLITRR